MKLDLTLRPINLFGLALIIGVFLYCVTLTFCRVTWIPRWNELTIRLYRDGCIWHCPQYSLEINEDGSVVYQGKQYVDVAGIHTTTIDPASVRALVQAFEEADFYAMGTSYEKTYMTDGETTVLSLTVDGRNKSVRYYSGDTTAPPKLRELENAIDLIVGSQILSGDTRGLTSALVHGSRASVRWLPGTPAPTAIRPTATPTLSNLDRVGVILKTPQPTPLAQALANETGLVPGQTTQEQALAREGWLPGEVREHGWVYRYFHNEFRAAFDHGLVVQVEIDGGNGTADSVIEQYGAPEVVVVRRLPYEWAYPSRGLVLIVTCRLSSSACFNEAAELVVLSRHYFTPMTLNEWVAREQPYWPEGCSIQGWGR